jgi:hypothetical protein
MEVTVSNISNKQILKWLQYQMQVTRLGDERVLVNGVNTINIKLETKTKKLREGKSLL